MKKLILLSFISICVLFASAQPLTAPKGLKIGKTPSGTSVITIDSLTQYSTDAYRIFKGATLLQPYIPDLFKVGGVQTTSIGNNIMKMANPNTVSFPQFNANNTISPLSDVQMRAALNVPLATDSVTASTLVVMKADSSGTTPGKYVTGYDFRLQTNYLKKNKFMEEMKAIGSNFNSQEVKYFPAMVLTPLGTTITMVDGRPYLEVFYVFRTDTVTGVGFVQQTAGNFVADKYNGFKLFSLNTGTNAATVIDSTANDGNIWKTTAFGKGYKAFGTQRILTPGAYLVMGIWNTSDASPATVPVIYNHAVIPSSAQLLNGIIKAGSYLSTTSYLPNTTDFDTNSAVGTSSVYGLWLYK